MKFKAVIANPKDNVATVVAEIEVGEKVLANMGENIVEVIANQEIPFGHKISLSKIAKGEDVVKYGEVIGMSTQEIKVGDYVHAHNVESKRGRGDLVK